MDIALTQTERVALFQMLDVAPAPKTHVDRALDLRTRRALRISLDHIELGPGPSSERLTGFLGRMRSDGESFQREISTRGARLYDLSTDQVKYLLDVFDGFKEGLPKELMAQPLTVVEMRLRGAEPSNGELPRAGRDEDYETGEAAPAP